MTSLNPKPKARGAERRRRGLLSVIEHVAAVLLAAIMICTVADVVARYFFHRPIAAAFELTEMTMQVMIYLCIAVAVGTNDHIKVTLIDSLFNRLPRLEGRVDRLASLLSAMAFAYLGYTMADLARGKAVDLTPVLNWPIAPVAWLISGAMFVSAILAFWSLQPAISPKPHPTGGRQHD